LLCVNIFVLIKEKIIIIIIENTNVNKYSPYYLKILN
jgi:hypothetical protein